MCVSYYWSFQEIFLLFFPLSPFSLTFINLLLTGMGRVKQGELEMSVSIHFQLLPARFCSFQIFCLLWRAVVQGEAVQFWIMFGPCALRNHVLQQWESTEIRNGPSCDGSSCSGFGNQQKYGQKCGSGFRGKSGNIFLFWQVNAIGLVLQKKKDIKLQKS